MNSQKRFAIYNKVSGTFHGICVAATQKDAIEKVCEEKDFDPEEELQAEEVNPNPWVLVRNPGQDDEDIIADFPTCFEAVLASRLESECDIMKRLDDGTLTTEF